MNTVLTWVGSKRNLLPMIKKQVPSINEDTIYIEPFLGGGSVLFSILPNKAIVNDINSNLISFFLEVKNNPKELIEHLEELCNQYFVERDSYYYKVRNLFNEDSPSINKAAAFMFLNKTCYNGLYRVNKKGKFNVPHGRKVNPTILDKKDIQKISNYLNTKDIQFNNMGYNEFLDSIIPLKKPRKTNIFVYIDPPYHPITVTSNFTMYSTCIWNVEEQGRLKEYCDRLNNVGIKFLAHNSYSPFILELYKNYEIVEVEAPRFINSKPSGRGKIKEIIIKNY